MINHSCHQKHTGITKTKLYKYLLATSLLVPTAPVFAVSMPLTGGGLISGTDCGIATYRYPTAAQYTTPDNVVHDLDIRATVLDEDNDKTSTCITRAGELFQVDIDDADAGDNVASMDFEFTVVDRITGSPVEVDRILITGFDLDSNGDGQTETDDIYMEAPDGAYISSGSNVLFSEGPFGGVPANYTVKLKGQASGNCNDSSASPEIFCRGGGVWTVGTNVNSVSTVRVRVQNDNAYGQNNNPAAVRRFQLSFKVEDLDRLVGSSHDYGDAPNSYGSAVHNVTLLTTLGSGVPADDELAQQGSADATGDDTDTGSGNYDDDDAVSIAGQDLQNQTLAPGTTHDLDILTFGAGYLSVWIDFDGNGDFLGADEHIIVDQQVTGAGVKTTTIPISIPATATGVVSNTGKSFVRVRYSTAQGVGPSGNGGDGEVEDYQIAILGTVSGHLYLDANGNGTQDGGDTNLPDIDVVVTDVNGGTQTVTTDANGNWVAAVPPGDTSADIDNTDADLPAGSIQTEGTDPTSVTAVAGVDTVTDNDGFGPQAIVSGSVKDPLGNPVTGATVSLLDSDGNVVDDTDGNPFTVTVDAATGAYSFNDVPAGTYNIQETNPANYISTDESSDQSGDPANTSNTDDLIPVTVVSAEAETGNDFIDTGIGTVSGSVKDPAGNPVVGATVAIVDSSGVIVNDLSGNPLTVTVNPADGSYSFNNVPAGNYSIKETNPANYISTDESSDQTGDPANTSNTDDDIPVTVTAGETDAANNFIDTAVGTVSGSVKDPAGNPVVGANISIVDGSGVVVNDLLGNPLTATVNPADGSYSFSNVPAGTYIIKEINPAGYTSIDENSDQTGDPANTSITDDQIPVTVTAGETDSGNDFIDGRPPQADDETQHNPVVGSPTEVDVLVGDTDPDGDNTIVPTSVSIVSNDATDSDNDGDDDQLIVPGEGRWVVDNASGKITFTPLVGYQGDPTPIHYTVKDEDDHVSNVATITVTYGEPPVADHDSKANPTLGTPTELDVLANDSDSDGTLVPATLQIQGTDNPGNPLVVTGEGTWSIDPETGKITFTPEPGFIADPTPVRYTIDDNDGNTSAPAKVTVTYGEGPVATDNSLHNPVVGTPTELDVLLDDSDPDGSLDPLTVQIVGTSNPGDPLTVANEGEWTIDPVTGKITFTPEADFKDNPSPIQYTVDDNDSNTSNPATVRVTYGKPPLANLDGQANPLVGTPTIVDIVNNDNDIDGTLEPSTVKIVNPLVGSTLSPDSKTLTVPGEGIWIVDPVSGVTTFTPEESFNGNPTPIEYTVEDNDGNVSDPATITVTYGQLPEATHDSKHNPTLGTITEVDALANDNDTDGTLDPATVQIVGTNNPGESLVIAGEGEWSVDPATGMITFTPEADYTDDPAPIRYTVNDNDGNTSNQATVTVTYEHPPIATPDSKVNPVVGSPTVIDVIDNDSDPDGTIDPDTIQIVGTNNPGEPLIVPGEGEWSVNVGTGTVTFTPETGFIGNPTPIEYIVDDNAGNPSNPATVTVSYGDGPLAIDDSKHNPVPGTPTEVIALSNDNDPDGALDPATVRIDGTSNAGDPLVVTGEGEWTINPVTGNITFTPEAGFSGDPTPIQYSVEDNDGNVSNPATVTVTYGKPPLTATDAQANPVPGTATVIPVLSNDTDADGTLLPATVQIIGTSNPGDPLPVAGEGVWTVNPTTGDMTFTPEPGFIGNPTPIQYSVEDNDGNRSNPATVTVTYSPTGIVAGTVYEDSNGNGTQDPGEPGIANVSVDITDINGTEQTLTTDNNGNYAARVPIGDTVVDIVEATLPTDFIQTAGSDPTTVTVPKDGIGSDVDGFRPPINSGILTGVVYEDSNNNGTQDDGEPGISGVTVTITDSKGGTQILTTDTSGHYSATVPAGAITVDVDDTTLPGGSTQTEGTDTTVVVVPAGGTANDVDGYQPAADAATISGVIYADSDGSGTQDAGESGISGVQIEITDSSGNIQTVTTDVNGSYSATVPAGITQLNVDETTLPGNSVQTEGSDITTLTIAAGEIATDVDGYQPPSNQGSLRGIVYEDSNGNGTQDADEPGIAGVDVTITDSAGGIQTVVTDSNGAYSVSVPAGNTLVDIDQNDINPTFAQSEGSDPTTINVPAGGIGADVDGFTPAPKGVVAGTIYQDSNGNGTQDPGEPGIANVSVVVTDVFGATQTLITDNNGNYAAPVPVGETLVDVDETTLPTGFIQTQGTDITTVIVPVKGIGSDVDGYKPPVDAGTLTGTVYEDSNGNGVQDTDEPGIEGVTVTLTDSQGGTQTLTTDANGHYTVTVPAGETTVAIDETTLPGGSTQTEGNNSSTVTVPAGGTATDTDGYQPPADAGDVSGVVYEDSNSNGSQDADELGIPGVQIKITDAVGNIQTVTTDELGAYAATVPAGETTLNVDETTIPGGSSQTEGADVTTVTVPAGGAATDIDGYAPPANQGTLSGIVYEDSNGNGSQDVGEPGIAGADVTITDSEGSIQTVVTDTNGQYSVSVPAGDTLVDIDQSDVDPDFTLSEGTDPTTVQVPAAGTGTDVDGFKPGGIAAGTLYEDSNGNGTQDPGEPGMPNVNVVITDVNGRQQTVTTDDNGNYAATVPEGKTIIDIDESTLPGGFSQTEGSDPTAITVPSGGIGSDVDGYQPPADSATVNGVVYKDTDGNGSQDKGEVDDTPTFDFQRPVQALNGQNSGEPGYSGVTVIVTDSLGGTQILTTDAEGKYSATVPAGLTTLDIKETTLPGGSTQTEGGNPTTVTVPAGGSASDVDGYVPPADAGTVTGTVYEDSNGNGSQDTGESGIPGVQIEITDVDGNIQTVTTNDTGVYTATVPAGEITLDVDETTLPGGSTQTEGTDVTIVTISSGGTVTDTDGYAPPINQGNLTGIVYLDSNGNGAQDAGESGLSGVDVTITDSEGGIQTVITGSEGRYTVKVPAGNTLVDIDQSDIDASYIPTEGTDPTLVAVPVGGTGEDVDGYQPPALGTIRIAKTGYGGHDNGQGCGTDRAVNQIILVDTDKSKDERVTYCFEITNQGTGYLTDIQVSDVTLGVQHSQLSLLNGPAPIALAPNETLTYYYEVVASESVDNIATVTARLADVNGNPTGGVTSSNDTTSAELILIIDPPSASKTVTPEGDIAMQWQMVWINDSKVAAPGVVVYDEVPVGTHFQAMTAGQFVSNDGVYCEARGQSVTQSCYYEGASTQFPRGRVVWEGVVASDPGLHSEADASNEVVIRFISALDNPTQQQAIENQATSEWDFDGNGTPEIFVPTDNPVTRDGDVDSTVFTPRATTPTAGPQPIPTLSEWMMLMLSGMMGLLAWGNRKKGTDKIK